MTYENLTESDIARMSPHELQSLEKDVRRELVRIEHRQAAVARELKEVEKDLREYNAQQAYWAAKYCSR